MKQYKTPDIRISKGNTKLGAIASVSLPPGQTCARDAPCRKLCYALKAYRMYKQTKTAYDRNLDIWNTNPEGYMQSLAEFIASKNIHRFRWHVSGDIVNDLYFEGMKELALACPDTHFMLYTKKWEYALADKPSNINILLSMWPGYMDYYMPMLRKRFGRIGKRDMISALSCVTPLSWFVPSDINTITEKTYKDYVVNELPQTGVECPGNCDNCFYCWYTPPGTHIVFKQH